jgi:hypothetical protein
MIKNLPVRKRSFAYSEIFLNDGKDDKYHKNESNCTVFLNDGTWFTTWGQGVSECHPDERIVSSKSIDMGKTWSLPKVIDQSNMELEERVAYGIPFVVPTTGRIYLFFFIGANTEGKLWAAEKRRDWSVRKYPLHESGILNFRYSDDAGDTWSQRYPIVLPDRDINAIPGRIHGWLNHSPIILPSGDVIFTSSHLRCGCNTIRNWKLGAAEVNVIKCCNILTESDPNKLEFKLLPEGPFGIRTNVKDNWDNPHLKRHLKYHNGLQEETLWSFQEMTVIPAPDGRLIGIGRAYLGSPGYTVSHDNGNTWSRSMPLHYAPDGEPIRHPMTMCPVAMTSSGKVILMFTDNDGSQRGAEHLWDGDGRTRNPQYFTIGEIIPGEDRNAGLVFGEKILLAEVDDTINPNLKTGISMPHFFEYKKQYFVCYNINKEHIVIDKLPSEFFE